MDDISEPLKRLYRGLDHLDDHKDKAVRDTAANMRAYLDEIAETVDYEPEE